MVLVLVYRLNANDILMRRAYSRRASQQIPHLHPFSQVLVCLSPRTTMSNITLGPLHISPKTVLDEIATWMQTTIGSSTIVLVLLTFLAPFVYPILFRPAGKDAIHELRGLPVLTAWPFFSKRYDFLMSNFEKTGRKMFKFSVLKVSRTFPNVSERFYNLELIACAYDRILFLLFWGKRHGRLSMITEG